MTLGFGLPFSAGRGIALPPQPQALFAFLESTTRINTLGEVSSWVSSTPGTLTVTGASGQRPDIIDNFTRFDSSDRLTFPGDALGPLTKATIFFWVKVNATINANDTLLSTSSDHFGTSGQLAIGTFNNQRWIFSVRGVTSGGVNGLEDGGVRLGVWQAICCVYDGSEPVMIDRTRVWLLEPGQTIPKLQSPVQIGATPTNVPAGASSIGAICDAPTLNRQLPGDIAAAYIYRDAVLTSSEIVKLAKRQNPLSSRPLILPLGDSITLGVGDTATHNGYRSDLLALAGDQELWWFGGTIIGGAQDINRRCQAVGGSKVDAHLTQFNNALSEGWDPKIILYCGGRNDISAGEIALLPARYTALFTAFAGRPAIVHVVPTTNPYSADTATANDHLITAASAFPNVTIVDGGLVAPVDMYDSVHPNAAGYEKMAGAFWAELEPIL